MKTSIFLTICFFMISNFGLKTTPEVTNHKESTFEDIGVKKIDAKNAKITFDFVSEKTSGTISELELQITFDPEAISQASFKGTALVESIDTGNFLRDGHLMWKKFFHKSKFPKIKFESNQVNTINANTFDVLGALTIKGTTKQINISFTLDNNKLLGQTTIFTSDFGVNIHDIREENKLNIQFDFPFL